MLIPVCSPVFNFAIWKAKSSFAKEITIHFVSLNTHLSKTPWETRRMHLAYAVLLVLIDPCMTLIHSYCSLFFLVQELYWCDHASQREEETKYVPVKWIQKMTSMKGHWTMQVINPLDDCCCKTVDTAGRSWSTGLTQKTGNLGESDDDTWEWKKTMCDLAPRATWDLLPGPTLLWQELPIPYILRPLCHSTFSSVVHK